MKLFFSFKFGCEESDFISKLSTEISNIKDLPNPKFDAYFNPRDRKAGKFRQHLKTEIDSCGALIFFVGNEIGETQNEELQYALKTDKIILPVYLPSYSPPEPLERPKIQAALDNYTCVKVKDIESSESPQKYAQRMSELLRYENDGLPSGYPFSYEKEIIAAYLKEEGIEEEKIRQGCPKTWPDVDRNEATYENPVPPDKIGAFRDLDPNAGAEQKPPGIDPRVLPAALSDYHNMCLKKFNLSFPEAGPRKWIAFSEKQQINIGILISGGIAPGVNAVLAGLMKRQVLYADEGQWSCRIILYREGLKSLTSHTGSDRVFREYNTRVDRLRPQLDLELDEIFSMADSGGSYLPTARSDNLLPTRPEERHEKLMTSVRTLRSDRIDILYIIGGDGSMKAAHAIQTYANRNYKNLAVIAIPKTMDNDVLWVWQSFGFPSAVEWAKDAIRQLYTEARSNPRLCVVQLFGSDSGFVVSHAALASGVCDYALIPEIRYDLEETGEHIISVLESRRRNLESPYGIILMAETALPKDPRKYIDLPELKLTKDEKIAVKTYEDNNYRVYGQTPDDLRSAALKIVSGYMRMKIAELSDAYWEEYRVFTNEPRHLIRSVRPGVADIIFGERLGSLAVDGAMAGYKDFMISQWLTEFVLVPLKLVVLGRKRIPTDGIFWRSVLAKTGQKSKN